MPFQPTNRNQQPATAARIENSKIQILKQNLPPTDPKDETRIRKKF
jgi:hypothetical protein